MHLLSRGGSSRASSPGGIPSGRGSEDVAILTQAATPVIQSNLPAAINAIVDSIPESIEVVCIGECTHGTQQFYDFRAEITKALIMRRGFNAVVLESDFPDTSLLDAYAKGIKLPKEAEGDPLFLYQRFPQ
jgi:erythromycin esterase-like protein